MMENHKLMAAGEVFASIPTGAVIALLLFFSCASCRSVRSLCRLIYFDLVCSFYEINSRKLLLLR